MTEKPTTTDGYLFLGGPAEGLRAVRPLPFGGMPPVMEFAALGDSVSARYLLSPVGNVITTESYRAMRIRNGSEIIIVYRYSGITEEQAFRRILELAVVGLSFLKERTNHENLLS